MPASTMPCSRFRDVLTQRSFEKTTFAHPAASAAGCFFYLYSFYTMFSFIFLQAPSGGMANLQLLLPFLILIVFYFFIFRPQIKRQKEQQKFADSLKEGMEVVTTAGIIGRITKIDGNVVRLMVDEKTFMRVVRQTITSEYKPA